jgi:hypothetical protein
MEMSIHSFQNSKWKINKKQIINNVNIDKSISICSI